MVKISRVEMKGIMENIMSYKGSESQDKTRRKDIWHQQRIKQEKMHHEWRVNTLT